jgi:indolepyruvate ferredoxin oxidoreductase
MTGGQQVGERPEGHSVLQIMKSLLSEGVAKLVIVTDQPEKYQGVALEPGVVSAPRRARPHPARVARDPGLHRDHLRPDLRHREAPPPQARQAGHAGQARGHQRARLRRLRRLQRAEQLPERGAGGDRVRPQAAHQPEHLQQGLLLREGLLPELRHRRGRAAEEAEKGNPGDLSACRRFPSRRCRWPKQAWGIVVAGVGGTGVITIGQLLGMAAHLEGKGVVTQDAGGLAQKGGATWSHVQIANRPEAIFTTKVDTRQGRPRDRLRRHRRRHRRYTLAVMQQGRTFVAMNTHGTPTAVS